MRLNVGPQHPSTHGVLRLVVDMDGEKIKAVKPQIGYLHTGFEKTMENRTYQQGVTYSNRMDYLHGFGHDLAYVLAVEKLLDAKVPVRAQQIRIILTELNRIASHLVFFGTGILDMGAL
ncbi:MAG: NADH-quinone oxidoreductase subunit D, partial [Deinococcales bacterium]